MKATADKVSLVVFQHPFAHFVHGPVISATKNANEMEIVMMSRVLGLRLNAMLMEDWALERLDTAAGEPLDVAGERLQAGLIVECRGF